ncbi:MAG TPA: hypothetical protein PLA50_05470, partial [Bacteroidia bacterium]|nr:hypothetical protein [Bacteroidia bacterium]
MASKNIQRLALSLAALAAFSISPSTQADTASLAAQKAEQAHGEMWRRFVDEYGIVIDYADLEGNYPRPTPEECREGKPNALAWWTATENGGMFNGTYMDAAVLRWKLSGADEDAEKARRLAKGLMLLASVSEVPG